MIKMIEALFRYLYRKPIIVILVLIVPSIISLLFLKQLSVGDPRTLWVDSQSDAIMQFDQFQSTFRSGEEIAVAYQIMNTPFSEQEAHWQQEFASRIKRIPGVLRISMASDGAPFIKPNRANYQSELLRIFPQMKGTLLEETGKSALFHITIGRDNGRILDDSVTQKLLNSLEILCSDEGRRLDRKFYISSSLRNSQAVGKGIIHDISILFPGSILLGALILFLTFRHWSYILFPLLSTATALLWTFGLMGYCQDSLTPLSTTLFVLVTVIGVADSVHLFTHFNHSLRSGMSRDESMISALIHSGIPCFWTFAVTAIGFLSLLTSPIPAVARLGIYSTIGVACAFITSLLTFMLAVRCAPKIPRTPRHACKRLAEMMAGISNSHSKMIIAVAFLLLVITIPAIKNITVESGILTYLNRKDSVRLDAEYIQTHFPNLPTVEFELTSDTGFFSSPQGFALIDSFEIELRKSPTVTSTTSPLTNLRSISRILKADTSKIEQLERNYILSKFNNPQLLSSHLTKEGNVARISVGCGSLTPQERREMELFFPRVVTYNSHRVAVRVTGFEMVSGEITENIVNTQFFSLTSAFIPILLVMLFLFGIRGGICAILINMPPLLFLIGVMGYGKLPLTIATATIASIALGIVVDDTIHYLFSYRRAIRSGEENPIAIRHAHREAGEAIVITSLILISGLLLFLLADSPVMVQFGILSSFSVGIALFAELILSPALLLLINPFGRRGEK